MEAYLTEKLREKFHKDKRSEWFFRNTDMILRNWNDLPEYMRTSEVRPYYDILKRKQGQLILKRVFDILLAFILLILLALPMLLIAIIIKIESDGPAIFRQERITTYGKTFRIHKFRTMINGAEKKGASVTVSGDRRVTRVGAILRHLRLDELPQLIDVISGNMSFVGTRPEVAKYVEKYKPEYYATLLMPAGITSEAAIRYKDEARLLDAANDVDKVYIERVLPDKMMWNLESIKRFRFLREIVTMIRTVLAVLGREFV